MTIHTTSTDQATAAQLKLCSDLIDAGAGHELNMLEKPLTKAEASAFIAVNADIYSKLKKERARKRK